MAQTTTPATIEVAPSKKTQDVDKFVAMSTEIDGIYLDVRAIMEQYHYPVGNLAEFMTIIGELKRHLQLAATFIINPDSPGIADGIRERIKCGID